MLHDLISIFCLIFWDVFRKMKRLQSMTQRLGPQRWFALFKGHSFHVLFLFDLRSNQKKKSLSLYLRLSIACVFAYTQRSRHPDMILSKIYTNTKKKNWTDASLSNRIQQFVLYEMEKWVRRVHQMHFYWHEAVMRPLRSVVNVAFVLHSL